MISRFNHGTFSNKNKQKKSKQVRMLEHGERFLHVVVAACGGDMRM